MPKYLVQAVAPRVLGSLHARVNAAAVQRKCEFKKLPDLGEDIDVGLDFTLRVMEVGNDNPKKWIVVCYVNPQQYYRLCKQGWEPASEHQPRFSIRGSLLDRLDYKA